MELPALKLPQIELPFDIPVLLHPPVDHFVIAIPILVLVIEIINLVAKKRAIGVISFILLLIGMVAAVGAYLTGTVDGKEAFDALSQAGQSELKEHKLLGTYLVLASAVLVVFKMLSSMVKRGLMKALFFLVLIVYTAGILKQGKDGGELVYHYGANVERVTDLDSELFDVKEELDELKEKSKSAAAVVEKKMAEVKEAVSDAVNTAEEKTAETADSVKETVVDAVENAKDKAEELKESVAPSAVEPEEASPSVSQSETPMH
jgi:uncharacterized membrane protein/vacuolar-type H+-ATPase subunit H